MSIGTSVRQTEYTRPSYNGGGFGNDTSDYGVPNKGGGDWGRKMRQFNQESMKNRKIERETEYFWFTQEQNALKDKMRGGPPRKGKRRLDEEELEMFKCHTGAVGINFDKYDVIPVQRIGEGCEDIPVIGSFPDIFRIFKMPEFVSHNVSLLKYNRPTPVQKYALPAGLCGRDLMCCAQTGSGKTATFLVPIFGILDESVGLENTSDSYVGPATPKAVILAPTRELCSQITLEAMKFANRSNFRVVQIYGGVEAKPQLEQLTRGCDILTATPGRLIDFIDRGVISMSKLQILVLDEADRMLDMGFEPQIRNIVERRDMSPQRQTMLFSATFPKEIQHLAMDFLFNYIWVAVGRVGGAADSVTQEIVQVRPEKKIEVLLQILCKRPINSSSNANNENDRLLTSEPLSCPSIGQTLIFVARKKTASYVAGFLSNQGISSSEIHGDLSQAERERSLAMFRRATVNVLVATDVAARGLDIPAVEHVINYDLPGSIDDYIHRIGRTGRIGNTGMATSLYVASYDCIMGGGGPGEGPSSNISLAKDLVRILEGVGAEVPQFLMEETRGKTFNKNQFANNSVSKFGGRDIRNGNFRGGMRRGGASGGSENSFRNFHNSNSNNNQQYFRTQQNGN